jgi:hypothetical protein
MLLSIFNSKIEIFDYLTFDLGIHMKSSIAISKCNGGPKEESAAPILFCLVCALIEPDNKVAQNIFKELWSKHDYLWDYHCLKNALLMTIIFRRDNLFDFIMRSKTTQSIFMSFTHLFRIEFIEKFLRYYLRANKRDIVLMNQDDE